MNDIFDEVDAACAQLEEGLRAAAWALVDDVIAAIAGHLDAAVEPHIGNDRSRGNADKGDFLDEVIADRAQRLDVAEQRLGLGRKTLPIVAEILREAGRPLRVKEIIALGGDRLPTNSKTPETAIGRDLALDIKHKRNASAFVRVRPGLFTLRAHPTIVTRFEDGTYEVQLGDVEATPRAEATPTPKAREESPPTLAPLLALAFIEHAKTKVMLRDVVAHLKLPARATRTLLQRLRDEKKLTYSQKEGWRCRS